MTKGNEYSLLVIVPTKGIYMLWIVMAVASAALYLRHLYRIKKSLKFVMKLTRSIVWEVFRLMPAMLGFIWSLTFGILVPNAPLYPLVAALAVVGLMVFIMALMGYAITFRRRRLREVMS